MAAACFISNVLYGNKVLSSFELVRGYTPSILGSGQRAIPKELREAHDAMVARRLLSRMMKSKSSKSLYQGLKKGDKVFVLLPGGNRPRGRWVEQTVEDVRDDFSVVCGKGREAKTIAPEDVRTLPKSELAAKTIRVQHDVRKESQINSLQMNMKKMLRLKKTRALPRKK
eukprot:IDg3150t1